MEESCVVSGRENGEEEESRQEIEGRVNNDRLDFRERCDQAQLNDQSRKEQQQERS
jgi:hypothetical protein